MSWPCVTGDPNISQMGLMMSRCDDWQVFFFGRMLDALNEPYATAKMLCRRHATLPFLEAFFPSHSLCVCAEGYGSKQHA